MAAKKAIDIYANVAALDVTESGANTYTQTKFAFPFSIMDKMGLLIQRLEYEFLSLGTVLAASGQQIMAGITIAAISSLSDVANPALVDGMRLTRIDQGTAGSAVILNQPYIKDFSNLPGGGILVAPNPLYLAIQGLSAAAAGRVRCRMFYTYMELATDEYWQLVESRRIISS